MEEVSLETMVKVLKKVPDTSGLEDSEQRRLAEFIVNLFGFDDYIPDNRLTPQERNIFYSLEEAGLLGTLQDEVKLLEGKNWRLNYWVLKKKKLIALAESKPEKKAEVSVYSDLDEEMWHRHSEDEEEQE